MHRLPALALAAIGALATMPAAGHAADPAAYYVAVPAAQPSHPALLTRGTPWQRQGDAYVAARAPERDQVLCQLVAREAGPLQSFAVAGRAYDADALATCNKHARS